MRKDTVLDLTMLWSKVWHGSTVQCVWISVINYLHPGSWGGWAEPQEVSTSAGGIGENEERWKEKKE